MEQTDAEDLYLIARVNINVADIRRENKFRSERISQALFNELVEISDNRDNYSRVRTADNYEGWIADHFLTEHDSFGNETSFLVTCSLAKAYERPDPDSRRLTAIPYGCRLYGELEGDFLRISADRYGVLFIPLKELVKADKKAALLAPDARNIITEAEKFLGAPYLWGGRTFFGFDCSGFVQCIMRRFGVDLPRDSKDQKKRGKEIKRSEIRAGDLLFFPRHVTLAVSGNCMIHSSTSNGGVAYNCLDPGNPLYSEYYDKNFNMARRVIE